MFTLLGQNDDNIFKNYQFRQCSIIPVLNLVALLKDCDAERVNLVNDFYNN